MLEGATEQLIRALRYTIKTDVLQQATTAETAATNSTIVTSFGPEHLLVGSERHLTRFEELVGAAKSDSNPPPAALQKVRFPPWGGRSCKPPVEPT